ncbi:hypothetical protein N836_04295 [Leptolyngbya sp. Heron Island J]|uniref:type IV pilin-like G/H family protein n=1 Tax=Leptolyngbya sp. Heron Island J TaxID=1385935 RepID=UPI0003B981CD|nr:type IV pilin-like G/H family protein [Leptolyngbya sp. Heron Island J]ESA37222.1 hypothetical protein N836_04295 [Leptolyngbya sp. Heron Island J]
MIRKSLNALLAGLLLSCLPSSSAYPTTGALIAQSDEQSDEAAQTEQIITQLVIGRWELYQSGATFPNGFAPVLIFAPEGDVFYLYHPEGDIVRSSWTLDRSKPQPVVTTNLGGLVTAIPAGPDLMELHIEALTPSGNPDHDSITINARRVSSDISLPTDRAILEVSDLFDVQAAAARESEASAAVGAINRLQQAIFLEQQQFEPDIQAIENELGVNLQQSENYSYTLLVSDTGDIVSTVALPKRDGLKAIVGRVTYVTEEYTITTASLCKSDSFTDQMPELPDDIETCPAGYTPVY